MLHCGHYLPDHMKFGQDKGKNEAVIGKSPDATVASCITLENMSKRKST